MSVKAQLGVFSVAEVAKEVSILSALQMMNQWIQRSMMWSFTLSQDGCLVYRPGAAGVRTFAPFHADAKGVENVNLDLTSGSGSQRCSAWQGLFTPAQAGGRCPAGRMPGQLHGLHGEDGALQECWKWQTCLYLHRRGEMTPWYRKIIMKQQIFRGAGLPRLCAGVLVPALRL